MYLVWRLDAELPSRLLNREVVRPRRPPHRHPRPAGRRGRRSSASTRARTTRTGNVTARTCEREEKFRDHGLEFFEVVGGRPTPAVSSSSTRMRNARARAKFLPPESRAWTARALHPGDRGPRPCTSTSSALAAPTGSGVPDQPEYRALSCGIEASRPLECTGLRGRASGDRREELGGAGEDDVEGGACRWPTRPRSPAGRTTTMPSNSRPLVSRPVSTTIRSSPDGRDRGVDGGAGAGGVGGELGPGRQPGVDLGAAGDRDHDADGAGDLAGDSATASRVAASRSATPVTSRGSTPVERTAVGRSASRPTRWAYAAA